MLKIIILLIIPVHLLAQVKLIDVKEYNSSIMVEMKYLTTDNFVGAVIDGYFKNKCLMTVPAAKALAKAQESAKEQGYSLLVHDCYRPQRGVNHFIRWSKDKEDIKTKKRYYPNIKKNKLFKLGYIAEKSGHSRGSTIDLTLFDLETKQALDMGTIYDFLDPLSNTENPKVGEEALANRQILVKIMDQAGFKNYSKEWWHYTLRDEPNKKTYLDVLVK
jgi:D-alanyl-D-alanine dipeptidase